ncbi:MAG: terminase ATPase subunit [Hyphomonadaceae bacterium]|nr:MAG: terminase ATPase subunit [Hyphomonadaceae bacterium]KAF0182577.1 MAG: terminase ATPase subunit [Hyphomonadaceae bacterium]
MKLPPIQNDELLSPPRVVPYSARKTAMRMFWRGWDLVEIASELGLQSATVRQWKIRDDWDATPCIRRIEECVEARLCQLIEKPEYNSKDVRDIDLLSRQIERLARVRRYEEPGGHSGDLNPKVANRNAKPKTPKKQNYISAEHRAILIAAIDAVLFVYQKLWAAAGIHRNRFILKSRQIGATFYFALEALKRALETGNNQIFISASRAQANIFRQYIIKFVFKHTGVELKGDPMVLEIEDLGEKPEFHFLGTNYKTAQGYNGDVYIDECFWIYGFKEIKKVASAMATLKKYRRTYFSTPSTIHHEAFEFWSGAEFNKRKIKNERVKIDISVNGIKGGSIGGDGIWRQIVTLYDAVDGGNDLIDVEELKAECSDDEFSNLYLCEFIDDSQSAFPMSIIRSSFVDSLEVWKDFKPYSARPYSGKVWLSLDPANSAEGDPISILVLAPPKVGATGPAKKFRTLEKLRFKGMEYEGQAAEIKRLCAKYDVEEIVIDTSGQGVAAWQLVRKFFPSVRGINYNPQAKTQMVYKAKSVFSNGRIEIDAGWVDLAAALMSIHPKMTKGGEHITYVARRSVETGHGDLAWALLMALFIEPWDGIENQQKASIEFC